MNKSTSKLNVRSGFVKTILAIGAIVFLLIYFAQIFPLDNLVSSIWGTDNASYQALAIMAGAWAVIFIVIALVRVQSIMSKKNLTILSVLLILLLITLQIVIISRYDYVGNYDAAITKYQAFNLHNGANKWPDYFYYYTNTVGYVSFMKRILDFGQSLSWLGLGSANFIEGFQFLLVDFGLFGIYWTIRRRNIPAANIFLIFAIIYQPLHTNSFEFYSDSIAMVIPALFIFFNDLMFNGKKNWVRYLSMFGLIMLLGFAFFIKQNLVVLLIAQIIIVLLFWNKLRDFERTGLAVGVITSFLIFSTMFSSWKSNDDYLENQNRAFPVYTWMALGYNVESKGQFSQSDFFSYDSITTADEKTEYARDLLFSRLQGLGPTGILTQWTDKFRVMWSDSTFDSLRYQNSFIGPLPQHDKNPAQTDVRLRNFNQIIITAITLMTFMAFVRTLFKRKNKNTDQDHFLLTLFVLPVLGLTAFHVIFWEVESRYVTSLIPILLGLGSLSAAIIYNGMEARLSKTPKSSSRFILSLITATIILNIWSAVSLPNSIKMKNSDRLINTTASLPNGVRDYVGKTSPLFGDNYLLHYQPLDSGDYIVQELVTSHKSNQIWFSELPDGIQPSVINQKGDEWDLTLLEGQTYNFDMPAGSYKIRLTNNTDSQVKLPSLYAPYRVSARPMNLEHKPTLAIVTYNTSKNILKNLRPSRQTYAVFIISLSCVYYIFSKNYQPQSVATVSQKTVKNKNNSKTNNKTKAKVTPTKPKPKAKSKTKSRPITMQKAPSSRSITKNSSSSKKRSQKYKQDEKK